MTTVTVGRALVAAAAALVTTLGTLAPASAGAAPASKTGAAPAGSVRVIVTYDAMASGPEVARSVARVGRVTRALPRSPHLVATVPVADVPRLRHSPHVRSVQLDVPVKVALDSSLPVIRADVAHSYGLTGAGSTVAVLDTGVDVDHPFLRGRVVAQYCSSHPANATQQSLCPNGSTTDSSADVDSLPACASASGTLCDHGTHVAGIAAGDGQGVPGAQAKAGVAPGARIIAMQIFTRFNDTSFCGTAPCVASYTSDQIAALDELGALATAHPEWNVVAANLSLGGGQNSAPCDSDARKVEVDALLAKGIATVIAAGNNGFDAAVSTPACISSAVSVGATDDTDAVAWFSNRGSLLDVLAPGVSITSSVPDDSWATYSGTSMATPHVTGALALLHQSSPGRSIAQLVQDLTAQGKPVSYSSGGGSVTTPRIDVMASVDSVSHAPLLSVAGPPVAAPEGSAVTASGLWHDTVGDAVTVAATAGTVTQGAGTWSWSATRGDDLTLPVTVTATDAGGATRAVTFTARWTNVAPTVHLGAAPSTWRGAQLVTVDALSSFTLSVTDPGSDDVSATWSFGDGSGAFARSLVAPPTPDPASSPSVDPRSVTLTLRHTYTTPCARTLSVNAFDDDQGRAPTTTRAVVVLGTSTSRRSSDWWSAEYRGLHTGLSAADRACLLSVARSMSTVFDEQRRLTTSADANAVLRPVAPTTARSTFDARLLAVWLDVAAGSVRLSDPIASGLSGAPTTVGPFLLYAEGIRNTSSATSGALPPLTTVLTRIASTG